MAAITLERITKIVNKALEDKAYADRLFKDPDSIAQENGLSDDEKVVIKQMNRAQFDQARADADKEATKPQSAELSDGELESAVGGAAGQNIRVATAAKMVVGRSILAATGANYASASTAACDCCPWKGSSITSGIAQSGGQTL